MRMCFVKNNLKTKKKNKKKLQKKIYTFVSTLFMLLNNKNELRKNPPL